MKVPARTLVIIPAYNEQENICAVIKEIRHKASNCSILVINDGSQDATSELAKKEGVLVIDHVFNIGYGGALQTGFKYASAHDYDYVIQFDGDGQHDAKDIPGIIEALMTTDADIVLGSRFLGGGTRVGFLKRAAIRVFRFLIRFFTGETITDPTSGLHGIKRNVFTVCAQMGNFPADFPDADTMIYLLRKGYRVKEVPAYFRDRLAGRSMHSGLRPLIYFLIMLESILAVMIRIKLEERRERRTPSRLKKEDFRC